MHTKVIVSFLLVCIALDSALAAEKPRNRHAARNSTPKRSAPKYKLTYFNFRFLGEGPRQVLKQAGVPFEDVRITKEQWKTMKSKTPFGQLPVLEFDGVQIAQSFAISRYLARQHGLAGKTPLEEALVDSVADAEKDFFEAAHPYFAILGGYVKGDKEAVYNETVIGARDKFLPALEAFIKKSKAFAVGDSVTWADLIIAEYLATWESQKADFLASYPIAKEYVQRVRSLPNIKKWIQERPETPY